MPVSSGVVSAIYNATTGTGNVFVRRWPNATAGVKITAGATPAFSAWTQVVAAAKIASTEWLMGAFLEHVGTAGAAEVWLVDLATGAAGSEISISNNTATAQGFGSVSEFWQSAVGTSLSQAFVALDVFFKTTGAPRISGATAGLLVGGKDAYVAFKSCIGLGT